jgi:hypothetical protein
MPLIAIPQLFKMSELSHQGYQIHRGLFTQSEIEQLSPLIDDTHIVAECSPGDVLLMSPLILHSSRKSTIPNRRRILHFEYAKRTKLDPQLTWFESAQDGLLGMASSFNPWGMNF